MDTADLDHRFAYHPPSSPEVANAHGAVRSNARHLATIINDVCPEGREKSLAITHLEEAMMWANAAIARNTLGLPAPVDLAGDPSVITAPAHSVHDITVNGQVFTWTGDVITYEQIVELAGAKGTPTVVVSLRYPDGRHQDLSPVPGAEVYLADTTEVIIDCMHTTSA